MSIHIRHNTNDISTDTGTKPSIGGIAFNSMMPVVGSSNGAAMSVTTAAATATFTANEIVVKSALGGNVYVLPSYSQAINLATTGAGGMDTGTAPVSGYVALYAIYNPSTGASSILATNATAAAASEIYGGANMPAGYTASALISVWPTNASSQFVVGGQEGRYLYFASATALTTTTPVGATSLSIASIVPKNAKSISGYLDLSNASSSTMSATISGTSALIGSAQFSVGSGSASPSGRSSFSGVRLPTAQTAYYSFGVAGGTATLTIGINAYGF